MIKSDIGSSTSEGIKLPSFEGIERELICYNDFYKLLTNATSAIEVNHGFIIDDFSESSFTLDKAKAMFCQALSRRLGATCQLIDTTPIFGSTIVPTLAINDASSSSEAGTFPKELEAKRKLENLLYTYYNSEFDADTIFEFTTNLGKLIQSNGNPIISSFVKIVEQQVFGNEILSETLKAFGRLEDQNSKEERFHMLMHFINNRFAMIRDAAVSGLSFLDDVRALPQLRVLLSHEPSIILRKNISCAIRGLELGR